MTTPTADTPTRTERAAPRRNSILRVLGLSVALGAMAALLLTALPHPTDGIVDGSWWIAAGVLAGYLLAERYVFHIEYRREAITFTMSEVPTAFALVFLDPMTAIVIRVIGSMALIVLTHRPAPYKVVFNASLFAFEAAVAFTLVQSFVGPGDDVTGAAGAKLLFAIALAITASTLIGSLGVTSAIACFEGRLFERLRDEGRTILFTGPVGTAVAMVAVAPALFDERLAFLALVPVFAVQYVLVLHGRLSQRYRDLQALHGLAGEVGRSLQMEEVVPAALEEAARIMRADSGVLQLFGDDGHVAMAGTTGGGLADTPLHAADPAWSNVVQTAGAIFYDVDVDGSARANHAGSGQHIAVPIRDMRGVVGLLLLSQRSGIANTFDDADLDSASRLGEQLAAALRNALLHTSMEHAALHDELTGLKNRIGFDEEVNRIIPELHPNETAAICMLDLDRFKEVNDTLGHHVGDRVLTGFGQRVQAMLGPGEVLARFGGDEFAALIRRQSISDIRTFADELIRSCHAPLRLVDYDIVNTVSIGIAVVTDVDRQAAAVVRRADIAMYSAKRAHAGYEMYREEIDRRTPERLSLLGDLHDALENHHLDVHFQPKVDLGTRTVMGAEALVRWEHPARGWVSPIDFIRLAEETGLIKRITVQVLDKSLATLRTWLDAGHDLSVAVNLSTLDLLDEALPDLVANNLSKYRIDPHRLTLEITESSLMSDTPRAMNTIDGLHELGIKLSLDDFGTGYSSLSYLRRLPVSELKVDRSFVSNLLLDSQDAVIVKSTIDLGHNLGLTVTAEGIENDPISESLIGLHCDLGQGYGISRPLPNDRFMTWLDATDYAVPSLTKRSAPAPSDDRDARHL